MLLYYIENNTKGFKMIRNIVVLILMIFALTSCTSNKNLSSDDVDNTLDGTTDSIENLNNDEFAEEDDLGDEFAEGDDLGDEFAEGDDLGRRVC